MKFLEEIKFLFRKKQSRPEKERMTLVRLWNIEVMIVSITFLLILFGDLWVYQQLVANTAIPIEQTNNMTTLDKKKLKLIGDELTAHKNFLNKPMFPFIENPF